MGFIAPILAAVGTVAGAASSVMSLTQSMKKPPKQEALPVVPTVAAAKTDATADLTKKRRTSLFQGGQTDLTQGTGMVGAGNVGTKSLLGQ